MESLDILIVKTSSLGDVIHNMPAVTDLRRHYPHAHIGWLVEENYAPLVRLHPAVDAVIPVAVRRWRKQFHRAAVWGEIREFARGLRRQRYDLVIDTQGLSRSGILALLARGKRHGYDFASVRERAAALVYQVRHAVPRDMHAIDRNRRLVGSALGYVPTEAFDYGLRRELISAPAAPNAVLLHGSAQASKEWPEENWVAAGRALRAQGYAIVLPWGTERERERAERIAGEIGEGARVPTRLPLDQTARLLAQSSFVVGLDTGLLHLAAAFAIPSVAIFADSDPELTGPRGAGPLAITGTEGRPPDTDAVLSAVARVLTAQPA
jgi:heptosyltransferase I